MRIPAARLAAVCLACAIAILTAAPALADDFAEESLIIPMDTTYQDVGMLQAFGLVYQFLLADIPVNWCIKSNKSYGDADFEASAKDLASSTVISNYGYRGGPFVIDASHAPQARALVATWQADHTTTVHEATASFSCEVSRRLIAAPNIAVMADGDQDIAREYLMAAGIPDSTGDFGWPDTSPDMLDIAELTGPSATNHSDGALFDDDGTPRYCQLMSMHWQVSDADGNPGVVAEVREFLTYPTHFFAECQAVNAFENHFNGRFLTPNGFEIAAQPAAVNLYHADVPFAQLDGSFETVRGSEPAFSLPPGDSYKATDITMITGAETPTGTSDVWMTGFLDGACSTGPASCNPSEFGKISYLGGHAYDVETPISINPTTQGTRLALNSLFEAPCSSELSQPSVTATKSAAAQTVDDAIAYTFVVLNGGPGIAHDVTIRDTLPPDASFVRSTPAPTQIGASFVEWRLGSLASGEQEAVELIVLFEKEGSFDNRADVNYRAGLNTRSLTTNTVTTTYCAPETDAELCVAARTACGQLSVSDRCGRSRVVVCNDTGSPDGGETCGATGCDCSPGQVCRGRVCFDPCDEDAECSPILRELCYDSRCTADPCQGVQCGERQTCAGGSCFDLCDEAVDCSEPEQQCFDGRCALSACAGIACGTEQTCWGGSCFDTCADDIDCENPDEDCYGSRCTDDACRGVACAAGEVCWGGSCFLACGSDIDCSDPVDRCYEGRCTSDACLNVQCASRQTCWGGSCFDTCGDDFSCQSPDNVCYEARCATGPCEGVQCAGEQFCVRGYCRTPCSVEADCGAGEVCAQGLCGSAVDGCGCSSAQATSDHLWLSLVALGLARIRRRKR